ncbi:MAG: hypothetical protein JXB08_00665 [Bacilli bacterium]|nr:hypothetical protein [Bacilli bacterium]MBN2876866.1 hypothetical protein [Bacilli bacterium]
MIIKNSKILQVMLLLIWIFPLLTSCSVAPPQEEDFLLEYNISTEEININHDIVITATLSNLSKNNYKLEYSSYLIGIFQKGNEGAYLDILFNEVKLRADCSITATKTVSFTETGEYEYIVVAIFTVKDQHFAYRIPLTINVVD